MHWQDFIFSGLNGEMGRKVRRILGALFLVALIFGGYHLVWDLMMWRAHELLDPLTRGFVQWMPHVHIRPR